MVEWTIALPGLPENGTVYRRTAARGIIRRGELCLLIRTGKGDYKFPGGGVEPGETLEAALAREVLEETGHRVAGPAEPCFLVRERRPGVTEDIFEMDSHYFLCQVEDAQLPLDLDDYEAEEGHRPLWVPLEEALAANRQLVEVSRFAWVERENSVMEALLKDLPPR